MKHWILSLVVAGGLAALAACTDPGCIRSSECGDGAECRAKQCVLKEQLDAGGVRFPSDRDEADAS